ncbi:hypothetical protein PUN28_004413 [Cardiocondyla obscurior]|uniref:Uncharacterized protein n=1 Tax=Cardiocondyla obscurior TaxID=286306 RepID=A0AAW2GAN3_9HYME
MKVNKTIRVPSLSRRDSSPVWTSSPLGQDENKNTFLDARLSCANPPVVRALTVFGSRDGLSASPCSYGYARLVCDRCNGALYSTNFKTALPPFFFFLSSEKYLGNSKHRVTKSIKLLDTNGKNFADPLCYGSVQRNRT